MNGTALLADPFAVLPAGGGMWKVSVVSIESNHILGTQWLLPEEFKT